MNLLAGAANAELWSDAYSDAILLEALEPHVSILPPSWTSLSSDTNKHEGVRVRPSIPQAQILVQLRPGDQFLISSRRFSLTVSEPDPVQFTPSVSDHSMVVDLEDEDDNADTSLSRQDDGKTDHAVASASQPSLPGDEIAMLESPSLTASHQIGMESSKETSLVKTARKEQQNDSTREEKVQELNGGPLSDGISDISSGKGKLEQDSTPVELKAARVPHKLVFPGIRTWPEDNQSDSKALPIAAISSRLAQSRGETSPAPSETEVTHSRTLLAPIIPEVDKLLGDDVDISSVLAQAQAKPSLDTEEDQQTPNEQPPKVAQCPSVFQATEYHDAHPVVGSTTPSSPVINRASSHQVCDSNLAADSGVERTYHEEDPTEALDVLPQAESVDTRTSTIARVDELFHLAGADSDLNNIVSSPGKVRIATEIKAETKDKDWLEPGTDLAAIIDGSMESDDELDSPNPTSLPARGRPKAVQTYKLKSRLKRKLKSPEKDASLQLETPTKRRKTRDPESSMGSTIEVRPRSSRRKGMTSSQASKRKIRRVSAPSAEPNLSSPSQGTAQSQGIEAQSYEGLPPRVLFSSNSKVDEKPYLMAFFNRQGGRQVKAVKDCTILCVGPGELKKTSKLLLAVVSGKDVVRDKWLVDSARQHRLLDPKPYAAEDPDREAEWGTKLGDAIARGKAGSQPFVGWTIFFTPGLKKELGSGFLELKNIAILAGAAAVHARLPPKGAGPQPNTLVVASSNDRDAQTLAEAGWIRYSKDVISLSVLQGRLNTESFRLDLQPSPTEPDGGRRNTKR